MNLCVIRIESVGSVECDSSFECSSHETAVSITDVFSDDGRAVKNVVRHTQEQSFVTLWTRPNIDSDIDHEVDYSFHDTFGTSHGWL